MYTDQVLGENQKALLPLVKNFADNYVLVGGTALALQIGHRTSIDLDLFQKDDIDSSMIIAVIGQNNISQVMVDTSLEFTAIVRNVKMTFLKYPFEYESTVSLDDFIKMPDPVMIAAMKAYALGKRAKWKDYVDLYFVLQNHKLQEIIDLSISVFGNLFNERQFREQLSYFGDVDYTEQINYLLAEPPTDEHIKNFLADIASEIN